MSTGLIVLVAVLGLGMIMLGLGRQPIMPTGPTPDLLNKAEVQTKLDAMAIQLEQAILSEKQYNTSLAIQGGQLDFETLYGGSWSDFKQEFGKENVNKFLWTLGVGEGQSSADVVGARETAYYYFVHGTDYRLTQQPPVHNTKALAAAYQNLREVAATVQENAEVPPGGTKLKIGQ